jgi:hypothetical protein
MNDDLAFPVVLAGLVGSVALAEVSPILALTGMVVLSVLLVRLMVGMGRQLLEDLACERERRRITTERDAAIRDLIRIREEAQAQMRGVLRRDVIDADSWEDR